MAITIKNPVYNGANELISFDGIKLVNNQLDKTDSASLKLVEEIKALPRVKEYTGSAAPHVVIEGKDYKLSYKFFTDKEVNTYNAYRDAHGKGGSGSSKKGNEADEKTFDRLTELITKYKDKKEFAPVIEDIKNLRNMYIDTIGSDKKDQMLKELLGL